MLGHDAPLPGHPQNFPHHTTNYLHLRPTTTSPQLGHRTTTMATPTTATAAASTFVSLARLLPPRLTRFFARYPPGTANDVRSNPFKPTVFPVTGKWHNPVFSLRRQADLCKLARRYGVEELLPPTKKSSAAREAARLKRAEKPMRVRGHKEERTLKSRYDDAILAMAGAERNGLLIAATPQARNTETGYGEDACAHRGVETEGSWKGLEGLAEREGQVLDGGISGGVFVSSFWIRPLPIGTALYIIPSLSNPIRSPFVLG